MKNTIYPIVAYGNEILRKPTQTVEIKKDIQSFLENMRATMIATKAIGLAAPQVDKSLKIFVVDIEGIKNKEKHHSINNYAYINPRIISTEGEEEEFNEGCMSIPGVRINVKRKPIIKIRYYDENWTLQEHTLDGLLARVIQHENDHLEGILCIDYATPLKKKIISKKLNKIIKGDIDVSYSMKFK